ncbi:SGNH/GDSL hydrolase family protein [Streptomyces albireticuli]|uniref:SGNH/GDSL hydrolase family protein n=1 Tax=Streptomyces albireticuli TaxID=1940 RepID=UPI001B8031A1|nr:SGNH/GDSL hydrolase family protein [Streptomyces albireticuli]MCD9140761.1 SGNH/GDSL hydrolase family protein [Streptomyces albireticuli]MCD9161277.1 SGNH/GDSL hydrolase family protein [Streptomyces albireticuli]MCD9190665.1 SGNH/GDSL hydrolase family protein [Streptomyces albireticuli]
MAQVNGRGGQYGKALAVLGAATALAAAVAAPATAAQAQEGTPTTGQRYVALGDSYTSAPGVPEQSGGDCARSSVNYPALTAKALGIGSFKDVSCSGAKTDDMWRAQGDNPPQLNTLGRSTRLVTVGIGGNDIGFGDIIGTCAQLSATDPAGDPCRKKFTAGGSDELTKRIADTAPKIAKVLKDVHARAPYARVVLVGYPAIMPDNGVGCFPAVPIAAGDVPYLRDTEKHLNTMLKEQARKAGVRYADTYAPTVGHDVCKPTADRWIEGAQPENPAAPFHPNAKGESAMATAVLGALGHKR